MRMALSKNLKWNSIQILANGILEKFCKHMLKGFYFRPFYVRLILVHQGQKSKYDIEHDMHDCISL